jgi:hypothetical protein
MITAPQTRVAQGALPCTQGDPAEVAQVSREPISDFESSGRTPLSSVTTAIARALYSAGIDFGTDGSVQVVSEHQ